MQPETFEIWLDMQLSPQLANWISNTFSIKTMSFYGLGFNTEKDETIFLKAKTLANVFILTKDRDFAELQDRLKSPPKVILLKTGNCSNLQTKTILKEYLPYALNELINTTTEIIEIKQENIF